jgi:hypothetical protein
MAESDFAFLYGRWRVQNRRLVKRLAGSNEWQTFSANAACIPILEGLGNVDEIRTDSAVLGTSLRFFDKTTRQWSIWWVSPRDGVMQPPVTGGFEGVHGRVEGDDTHEGRPNRVRFLWKADPVEPRWEQLFSVDQGRTWESNWVMEFTRDPSPLPTAWPQDPSSLQPPSSGAARAPGKIEHLGEFPVIELRRYTCKESGREEFARYFESYFPEAFQQLGSLILGSFLERGSATGFVWIRAFHDMPSRASINEAFYGGPLWKEHSARMNERLDDHTNVLLLRPLAGGAGVILLPAVDTAVIGGDRGIAIAQIFTLRPEMAEAFGAQARKAFESYKAAGAREAAVLVTLDAPNNFPSLPVRTDGPHLVWLGVVKDAATLEARLKPELERVSKTLAATGALREPPELLLLDPGPRSRLRWLSEWR